MPPLDLGHVVLVDLTGAEQGGCQPFERGDALAQPVHGSVIADLVQLQVAPDGLIELHGQASLGVGSHLGQATGFFFGTDPAAYHRSVRLESSLSLKWIMGGNEVDCEGRGGYRWSWTRHCSVTGEPTCDHHIGPSGQAGGPVGLIRYHWG